MDMVVFCGQMNMVVFHGTLVELPDNDIVQPIKSSINLYVLVELSDNQIVQLHS